MSFYSTLFGFSTTSTAEADSFAPDLTSSSASVASTALGPYAVAINNRQFTVDTSFEPYRREAFRHRTIPSQRQSIMMTNIAGQGTVNTEGLWRREQVEWTMGAGQTYLDRKGDSQETRFAKSKGVDVFSQPLQATLLNDTVNRYSTSSVNLLVNRCGIYNVIVDDNGSGSVTILYTNSWPTIGTAVTTTIPTPSGVTRVYSITSNELVTYIATNNGIWYYQFGVSSAFALYAANDVTTGYTGGYDMVRWVNDQLVASKNNRLYAFQPRVASGYPAFGAVPSINDVTIGIKNITLSSTTATVTTTDVHNLSVGQPISIINSMTQATISSVTYSAGTIVATCSSNHGLSVGEQASVILNYGSNTYNETITVTAITNTTFTFNTTQVTTSSGFTSGSVQGTAGYGFNAPYAVASIPSTTTFTITVSSTLSPTATSGTVVNSQVPDMLYTHSNPNWVWSDACGGATQIYFSGYVKSGNKGYSGCIYRSNLQGSSTSSTSGYTTTSSGNAPQPFNLNIPVQALPMSPDEYPTCLKSYLNFIFIGTNRGVRMSQTLSVYDPTATATGDLKSGPLIPNITQPVTLPVTGITGDGRFVWFTWNNYDTQSTGLGKLDLSNFIAGDPLAPAYASDLMVTGQGVINSLDWDPITNAPIMAVSGIGVCTTNPNVYVSNGTIESGIFSYGIPDRKIPVFFDYGAVANNGTSLQASIVIDPKDEDYVGSVPIDAYTTSPFNSGEYPVPAGYKAEQFSVTVQLNSDTDHVETPILYRWTLKAWPTTVSETTISVVVQLFSVNVVDGMEVFVDPYESFFFLETLRKQQTIVVYQEGPMTANVIVEALDWLPHKRRDNYENGFEGDCVVSMKTIGGYVYNGVSTN
jgi:hypothetical protein